jgi:hypothetical protein
MGASMMMAVEPRGARWRAIPTVRSVVVRRAGRVSADPLVLNIDAVLLQRWGPVELEEGLDIFARNLNTLDSFHLSSPIIRFRLRFYSRVNYARLVYRDETSAEASTSTSQRGSGPKVENTDGTI